MIKFENSVFNAQGANKKDSVYGITLSGFDDIIIKGCEFKNTGYAAIMNHSTGNVTVEDCKFDCKNIYNPIEGSQKVDNGNLTVRLCKFEGAPGNNYINLYQFADESEHSIEVCTFEPTVDNNIIRVSNRTNATTHIFVGGCEYNFVEGEPTDYTNFLLCQDYTSKSGTKQDFTKVSVNLAHVKCNGELLSEDKGPVVGGIYYVYEDGKGIITGMGNDPVVAVTAGK